jgi:hypothetical protein
MDQGGGRIFAKVLWKQGKDSMGKCFIKNELNA